ncbi:hypothetical protein [Candidatus Aquicultor secundus]|uniref:hypothetical protein n=1 Tax=Candidatus Aquicultor secundus TaxID=1973895 RepID=UPI00257D57C4|nr:hypothetical protein [Candidatus Aquicultor secundus]NCO65331.1 hypothetical protein [Solirubrobacter sp.]
MRKNNCCQKRRKSSRCRSIVGFGLIGLLLSVLGFLVVSNYKNVGKEPQAEEQNILYLPLS